MLERSDQKITALGFLIWGIAAVFFWYEFFLRTFVGSIAHQLIHDLQLSIEQFTFISSAYYLMFGLMQVPVGILIDKFGVKRLMIFATLSCAAATFLFAHAESYAMAICGRLLMGFGSSFAFVCLLVIASNWFPKRFFGFFAGLSQFIGTIGPALAGGPLISWLVKSHISWRVALSNIGMFGILLALLSFLFVKGKPRQNQDEMLFLTKAQTIRSLLVSLFKTKQVWAIALYSSMGYVPIAVMAAVWGTNYLEAVGLSQQQAAYMISIAWLVYALACPLLGFLSDLAKRRKPFMVFCALLGFVSMSSMLFQSHLSLLSYECLFAMLGFSTAGQNVGFAAIAEQVSPENKASALGLNNAMITLLGAVLPLLISFLISMANGSGNAEQLSLSAFVFGLSVLPCVFFIALLASLFLCQETYCKPQRGFIVLTTR